MPFYAFEAMNSSGQEVKDEIEAATSDEAIKKIRSKGFFPTKVKEKAAKKSVRKKKEEETSLTPKRKMPLPVESHRKVSNPAPRFSCFACCCGFLVILDSRSREISRQDWIFMSASCFHTYTISCQVPCFFPHMHSETVLAKLVSYCL